ncbi:hypothetical protein K432DRAFT_472640 [Lepidopterella palustris CBS 459.81]|uniref:Uncharacterized protein n=1 Tax=Lepidopterella palustris CBS 459.81 TaxID=1314670 RepID=A0A8E2J8X8_9PEZI|nr:hypothetical protein K432DRAFT_472640 [Lepidopterella palustris CBS 459.81]
MTASTASRRRLHTASLVICVVLLVGPAFASADFGRCCMQSAREQLTELQVLPWEACGINQTSQSEPNPLVNSTLAWCMQNCPGFQLSTFNQWSDLLTTFIVPAFAQLLLCPVGSGGEDEEEEEEEEDEEDDERKEEKLDGSQGKSSAMTSRTKELSGRMSGSGNSVKSSPKKKRVRHTIIYLVSEYIVLLGDPASAMAACFYQLWRDCVYVWQMTRKEPLGTFKEHVRAFAILAGQTMLQRTEDSPENDHVNENDDVNISDVDDIINLVRGAIIKAPDGVGEKDENAAKIADTNLTLNDETISPILAGQMETAQAQANDVEKVVASNNRNVETLASIQNAYEQSELHQELASTIKMLLKAKSDFVNGIVIPVVLTFAGTAAGFYNAYTVLGDRDKGYSLAFGVFFAWLLVLSVVSNCYATTVNPTLLESSLNRLFLFCTRARPTPHGTVSQFRLRVVPFRKRIPALVMWTHWVDGMTADKASAAAAKPSDATTPSPTPSTLLFFAKFLFLQIAGWLCISIFTACASLIAYNTPTIGLGCRTFTFLLYTLLSLVLALLLPARVAIARLLRRPHLLATAFRILYAFLAFANALVLVGGTIFHLVGLFRSCRCQLLFGDREALVLLSAGTALDVERARTYWISVGYVAFTFAWMICAVAVAGREFIAVRLWNHFLVVVG